MTAKTAPPMPRIGIYVLGFPRASETFIVSKVLGLMDAGFSVTIFTATRKSDWNSFQSLKDRPDVRAHIIYGLTLRASPKAVATTLGILVVKAVRYPAQLFKLIWESWVHQNDSPTGFI